MKLDELPESVKDQIRAEYKPNKITQSMLATKYKLTFNQIHHIIQQDTCIAKLQRFDLEIEPKITKAAKEYKVSFNTMVNSILEAHTIKNNL